MSSSVHPVVVERLRTWLATKGELDRDQPIFNLRAAAGLLRLTAKMITRDLEHSRAAWIGETDDPQERSRRERSDFLKYQNEDGMYADFHSNRHTFITNLAVAGVHPKMAQSVARHSDVNLTMGIYSHVEMAGQSAAINSLPAPPPITFLTNSGEEQPDEITSPIQRSSGTGATETIAPPPVAPVFGLECRCLATVVTDGPNELPDERKQNPCQSRG